ncbi:MAG: hypothetical protein AAGH76_12480 [Pseudomonadota bacterium]
MQSSQIMVVAIIAIIFGSLALRDYWKHQARQQRSKDSSSDSEDADELNARIDLLEERVRTLEKIVTDPRDNLSRQINNL